MTSASKAFLVSVVVFILGVWGCSQNKPGATSVRVRDLENRNAKLEEDYRALLSSHDALRKKLAQAEQQRAELQQTVQRLEGVVRERDDLTRQLATRTGERDQFQAQLAQFGRELQGLASRIEAASLSTERSLTATTVSMPGPAAVTEP